MDVVVVESPAKAKTINKYLGDGYVVLASLGHVRDLREKDGAVEPDNGFAMHWQVDGRGEEVLRRIGSATRNAKRLFLATDPDREGEAISWHVRELLKSRGALDGVEVKRIVFNEITKRAVTEAIRQPRDLDQALIEAYLARRALDFLVGFTLSPVLWRKLPGSRSAGRVQSVALRLVCERELEIETFKPQEYWTIEADFATPAGQVFTARLVALDGVKLDKFALGDEGAAKAARSRIEAVPAWTVSAVETKRVGRNPPPPFTTSTLQQEASRKLRLGAKRTMQLAQRLYEGVAIQGETVGLITYMRTDGVQIAGEAIAATRGLIGREIGPGYLPEHPRQYQTKAKNAQEAHEAIRPTDVTRRPEEARRYLEGDEAALYELIWKRTVASQMKAALFDQGTIEIESGDGKIGFRATGSVPVFDGFLKLYQEGRDDDGDEEGGRLPPAAKGEALSRREIKPAQHFTEPPPRYSEASLVKKLEELGIGRPSTYASILTVLQDRGYVRLEKGRFFAEDSGRVVTAFLVGFFKHYVEYDFTAAMEEKLDDISAGNVAWREVLSEFWRDFHAAVEQAKGLRLTAVIDWLDKDLDPHIFPAKDEGTNPRACPRCADGRLGLKLSKNGPFVGCSNYPSCKFTRGMTAGVNGGGGLADDKVLGKDPESGLDVTLRNGRFGPYLQLGEGEGKEKPKRASIPRDLDPNIVDLAIALKLLALPRPVGVHPESAKPIVASIGRFGPYLLHDGKYANLASTEEVLTVGINRAVEILAQPKKGRPGAGRRAVAALRSLGEHEGSKVEVFEGRFGPYVKCGKINATIPKSSSPQTVTLEEAIALIRARAAKGPAGRKGKAPRGRKKPTA
ncbi:MAG: type I DNA topoisomerase [Alphaproteobacteria bacterium]|nr:type I DNA topoisomerase [Alphaproteobacteria bacterium]